MHDAINQPVQIGDVVAYKTTYSSKIVLGYITKVTPKGATISLFSQPDRKINRSSDNFIKINYQWKKFKQEHPEAFI
jgi:hypothetical protein